MELFHEYHNRFFTALVELAERIASGEEISAAEFEQIYYEIGSNGRKRIGDTFLEHIKHNTKLNIFDFSDRKRVRLMLNTDSKAQIANIPLRVERLWFEAAVCDDYVRLFFDSNSVQEMREKISDCGFPYYRLIDNSVCNMSASELCAVQPVFRMSLDAITEKHVPTTYTCLWRYRRI
ncbi:MAG: hypothetical protein K6C13_16175 [Oscillospiraceae bacterium]|nr:hypothetical protein [Oscillospiraceae bacterium]